MYQTNNPKQRYIVEVHDSSMFPHQTYANVELLHTEGNLVVFRTEKGTEHIFAGAFSIHIHTP